MALHISGKNAVSTIATVCVIAISIIAVAASPEQIKAWQGRIVLLGVAAIAASIIQMFWQSSDDDKQKEMMTTLLRAVVKSETKTEPRQRERAGTELDSTADPMVYVEIEDKRRGAMNPSTPFKLINRGKVPAHRVQIQPLTLRSGDITFALVEVLPHDSGVVVLPEVQGIFPIFRHDLSRYLQREWNDLVGGGLPTESQYEFVQPMSVTYETYDSKSRFETSFDVVYRAVQDIIQKDWHVSIEGEPPFLEIRNLRFKRQ